MNALVFEPVIGYYLLVKFLAIPDTTMYFCAVIFAITGGLQIVTYMSLIVDGFKDMKINHAMLDSTIVHSWNPDVYKQSRY